MPINEKLVWDYDIPPDAQENEAFREWYIGRVLTRGTDNDLRAIGLETIHYYFHRLKLPKRIRDFWEWYFNLPDVVQRYGNLDSVSKANPDNYR